MAYSALRQNFITSRQLLPGDWANAVTTRLTSQESLTASTTQTQAGATPVTKNASKVTTANANDAIVFPKGLSGGEIIIANVSANALGVFPAVGDTIFPSAQNAVLAQTASKNAIYKVIAIDSSGNATWYKIESA